MRRPRTPNSKSARILDDSFTARRRLVASSRRPDIKRRLSSINLLVHTSHNDQVHLQERRREGHDSYIIMSIYLCHCVFAPNSSILTSGVDSAGTRNTQAVMEDERSSKKISRFQCKLFPFCMDGRLERGEEGECGVRAWSEWIHFLIELSYKGAINSKFRVHQPWACLICFSLLSSSAACICIACSMNLNYELWNAKRRWNESDSHFITKVFQFLSCVDCVDCVMLYEVYGWWRLELQFLNKTQFILATRIRSLCFIILPFALGV